MLMFLVHWFLEFALAWNEYNLYLCFIGYNIELDSLMIRTLNV